MAYQINSTNIEETVGNYTKVYNYLRPNGFRFSIKDIPAVSYTCQAANIPSIGLGSYAQPTPFVDIPRFGDKLQFNELSIQFIIAEDMSNYLELFEWLVALGYPDDYNQYKAFTKTRLSRFPFAKNSDVGSELLGYSDGTLTVLDSNNQPRTLIIFKDLFPVSLETLNFNVTGTAVDYLTGAASFKYKSFDIEVL